MDIHIVGNLLKEEPGQAVVNALNLFLERDRFLLEIDANERSLTHRVAMYLQAQLIDWEVDCEYNRDNHEPKELMLKGGDPDCNDTNAQTVYPDIIAHRRGTNDNYLVIEFKKTSSTVGAEKDYEKLHAFKGQFGYQYALFIELETRHINGGVVRAEWINA